ncbi:hypothetical protein ScPMuIL_009123 [Solemya velum]
MNMLFVGLLLSVVTIEVLAQTQQSQCALGSCYPATGDLLIGRESQLNASSTCGARRPDRYCIVSHLQERTKCFTCDSREPWHIQRNSHKIENVVSSLREPKKWWQAQNGVQNVSIELNLEAEFHFTHLIMTFKTFRPKAMLVERSYDFGKTWKVYRYFAYDCASSFPGVPTGPVRNLNDVICTSRYSDVAPSTEGEVIFRVLPPFIPISDPYSPTVQDLLKLTDLRINFTELHTLGDTLLDNRPEIKEKYYYALYDMTVRGSCSCYGHASRCVPVSSTTSNRADMVHGQCECAHNTMGRNCERCEDFYNDLPWKPARQFESHACRKCNCNNHATKCHFDPAIYVASGKLSGGVCDDCQHNTMGKNCQECLPFFYQDPNRDIRDSEICQHCDCDPAGSMMNGECDSRTDPRYGLEAGRCHCKEHVEGRRCDTCVNGYWNLREGNELGCEACSCSSIGTIGNYGCDKWTGLCHCKRYVTGRSCDQCFPGYWGLSADLNGCRPCDCDVGGAVSDECDSQNGDCTCRPNIMGRACDTPRPGYFFMNFDYYKYEAEFGRGVGNARVYIREPISGGVQSWTGPGFMKIMEGDSIEFTVSNLDFPMYYDLVIRYDPRMPEKWEDVRVTVIRPDEVDEWGPCANHIPQDDLKATSLQPGFRSVYVSPLTCLETGKKYVIRLDFNKYKSDLSTPEATTLIDSIILVPNTDSIPIFQGLGLPEYMKNDFIRYRCREIMLYVHRPELPELCQKYLFSISSVIHQRALDCECDAMGSTSSECDTVGGQCTCKQNVVGRRCDQCAPGTYGFGPNGCQPCNCHAFGARDNFCDVHSGQCLCIQQVTGRICDECEAGSWGFPRCRACECNGHADICNNLDGRCIGCRDNTTGDSCESCLAGFHGDPRLNVQIACQPCRCPGGPFSEVQHADSCYLDHRTEIIHCECYPGFRGPDCGTCAENHYGDPSVPGGTCEQCICNNNIDYSLPGGCDTISGECLRCMYNTEGFSCEHCVDGYYGDATTQNCQACVCMALGTDANAGHCNRQTGQCPCLPNVIGEKCDHCAVGFWNLTSGQGCSDCRCDPDGSRSTQCNQYDGQCDCMPGRGGLYCDQCEDFYYGDPNNQCYPCECHNLGSAAMQCDRRTGQCVCMEGISGLKCDRCDRGTTGELPHCVPCGECFDNWDRVIRDLRDQTDDLVSDAKNITVTGVDRAFEKEFRQMEDNLKEIRDIINNANITSADIMDLERSLNETRDSLTDNIKALNGIDEELMNTDKRIQQGNTNIVVLKNRVEDLKIKAQKLEKNATDISTKDVHGAFQTIKAAQIISQEAQSKVDGTVVIVEESERTRDSVDNLITRNKDEFERKIQENRESLDLLDNEIDILGGRIGDLNEMVCDGHGEPCDALCGGGGCGHCGGDSCEEGAVTKAENALNLAKQSEELLDIKENNAELLFSNMRDAKVYAEEAKLDAEMSYNEAMSAKNQSEKARLNLEGLLNRMRDFLDETGASAEDIRRVAEEVLAMTIPLTPEQILELSREINKTIQGLQDIDTILTNTADDLRLAEILKERADNASRDASAILGTAQDVLDALEGSKTAQNEAKAAIEKSDMDITNAEKDLIRIESETAAAAEKSNRSMELIIILRARLTDIRKKYTENDINVRKAEIAANEAARLAAEAERKANELEDKYTNTSPQLDSKYNLTMKSRERAQALKERADKMASDTTEKLDRLTSMQDQFMSNQKILKDLSEDINRLNDQMNGYLEEIQVKSNGYRNCA